MFENFLSVYRKKEKKKKRKKKRRKNKINESSNVDPNRSFNYENVIFNHELTQVCIYMYVLLFVSQQNMEIVITARLARQT